MGEAPFTPPDRDDAGDRIVPGSGDALGVGTDTSSASQEVLDKLEALLGRLRGPDSPAEHPLVHPEIPTLDQPVTWTSPEVMPVALPAGRHIPTLTEPVELRTAREAESRISPAFAVPEPVRAPVSESRPTPVLEPVPDLVLPDPVPESVPDPVLPDPVPGSVPAPVPEPPDPTTRQELRERIESLLDPALEDHLCGRAMADLDRTLMDVERGFRDELAAWRCDQEARIRDQVRGEIERAVDEVVAALARERGAGSR